MLKYKTLKKYFSVSISVLAVSFIVFYFYIRVDNSKNQKELLSYAESIVNSNIVDFNSEDNSQVIDEKEVFSKSENEENNNVIGKIIINKIGVNAPIMEGTQQDVLKVAVGHFQGTSYWNGNIGLASHNRGSFAHYFERINELAKGDEIIYQTKLGTRAYTVETIEQIDECNWEPLESTEKNTLTLITCIKNKPEYRLCIKAAGTYDSNTLRKT